MNWNTSGQMENLKKQDNTVSTWRTLPQQCHIALQCEGLLLRAVLREQDSPLEPNSTPCIAHLSLLSNFLQLLQRWEFVLLFLQPSVSQLSLLQWHCCDLVLRLLPCAEAGNVPFYLPLVPVWWCFTPIMKSAQLFCVLTPPSSIPPCWLRVWVISGGNHFALFIQQKEQSLPFEKIFVFKYIYFAEFQGVFLYQAPALVWTHQQGFSVKFQHQMGFLCRKGKKNFFKVM